MKFINFPQPANVDSIDALAQHLTLRMFQDGMKYHSFDNIRTMALTLYDRTEVKLPLVADAISIVEGDEFDVFLFNDPKIARDGRLDSIFYPFIECNYNANLSSKYEEMLELHTKLIAWWILYRDAMRTHKENNWLNCVNGEGTKYEKEEVLEGSYEDGEFEPRDSYVTWFHHLRVTPLAVQEIHSCT